MYDIGDVITPLHLKLEEWHSQMARASEHCILTEDREMELLCKSKIIFPTQSYLFKLDPTNSMSLTLCRSCACSLRLTLMI